jgi:hypothetical protein
MVVKKAISVRRHLSRASRLSSRLLMHHEKRNSAEKVRPTKTPTCPQTMYEISEAERLEQIAAGLG